MWILTPTIFSTTKEHKYNLSPIGGTTHFCIYCRFSEVDKVDLSTKVVVKLTNIKSLDILELDTDEGSLYPYICTLLVYITYLVFVTYCNANNRTDLCFLYVSDLY